jgi:antagonist of KipI
VPPGGAPIVLGPDRATIGGYPVIGCVVSADWPLLAQLVPGERLGFEEVSLLEAERISIASERAAAVAVWGIRLIVPPASPLRGAK